MVSLRAPREPAAKGNPTVFLRSPQGGLCENLEWNLIVFLWSPQRALTENLMVVPRSPQRALSENLWKYCVFVPQLFFPHGAPNET